MINNLMFLDRLYNILTSISIPTSKRFSDFNIGKRKKIYFLNKYHINT